jgi:hypothetical protein
VWLRLGIRASSVVKVRVKVRLNYFVAVPASDHSADRPPKHDS